MAILSSRYDLENYALRQLGAPVTEINIDPDQIEDCLDDAIQYWQEFHSDATYKTYVSHQLTDSDVSNKYITTSPDVISVNGMFAIPLHGFGFADLKYEFFLNSQNDVISDLAYYEQVSQHIALTEQRLNGVPQTTYSRHQDKLYIHGDIGEDLIAGNYIMYEARRLVDPTNYSKIYNDMWLKEYTTALMKKQWGQNLSKFENMQLPGGVMINGRQILDDGENDIVRLREKIRLDHEDPIDFYLG